MSEAKWVKIETGMLNDPKLLIIDDMEDKNLIFYIWTSSILLAGQSNRSGLLYVSDNMPYTYKTLSVVFRRGIEEVKKAFKVLINLEMIEITEDKIFKIKNWEKHQNIESLDKIRKQTNERVIRHREKKREEKRCSDALNNIDKSNSEISDSEAKEEDKVIESNNYDDFVEADNNIIISKSFENKCNDDKNSSLSEKKACNVTTNSTENNKVENCNVTVTEQNKKEKKNKNKNKKEIEDNSVLSLTAVKLLQYYEQVTGIVGSLDVASLRLAITTHGEVYVKKAIDKAIETGKVNMRYINGILRNWRKEGYPEDDVGGINNGAKSDGKSSRADSNEFKGIKPKKCRELTEEERKNIESDLI